MPLLILSKGWSLIQLGSARPSAAGPYCTSGINKVGSGCVKALMFLQKNSYSLTHQEVSTSIRQLDRYLLTVQLGVYTFRSLAVKEWQRFSWWGSDVSGTVYACTVYSPLPSFLWPYFCAPRFHQYSWWKFIESYLGIKGFDNGDVDDNSQFQLLDFLKTPKASTFNS